MNSTFPAKFTVNTQNIFPFYLPPPSLVIFHRLLPLINLPLPFTLQQALVLILHSTVILLTWKTKTHSQNLISMSCFSCSCKSDSITVAASTVSGKATVLYSLLLINPIRAVYIPQAKDSYYPKNTKFISRFLRPTHI